MREIQVWLEIETSRQWPTILMLENAIETIIISIMYIILLITPIIYKISWFQNVL